MLFLERMGADAAFELVHGEQVDWFAWGTAQGMSGKD
jgi:hypothetical protein